jgi:hypothetical protein
MADKFQRDEVMLNSPADSAVAISANDSTVLDQPPRALYIGAGGDLVVRMQGSQNEITYSNVISGSILTIRVDKVLTSSTCNNIIGMY